MRWWGLVGLVVIVAVPAGAGWEEARAAYTAGNFEQALTEVRPVVEAHLDWAPGHYLLGLTLFRLQRVNDAVPSLERAVELKAGEPTYVLTLVTALEATERYARAREHLATLSYATVPENLRVSYAQLYATAAVRSGQPGEAIPVLEVALAEHAGEEPLWVAMGQAKAAAADDIGAFEAYSKALEIDSKDAATSRLAALTAQRIGNTIADPKDRELWYRWGAELAETAASAASTLEGYLLAGEVWLAVPDPAKAKGWLVKALELAPANPTALYDQGRADLELGNLDAAKNSLQRGLEVAQDDGLRSNILRSQALVHVKRKEFTAAAEIYRQVGDQGRAADMQRLAEIQAGTQTVDEPTRLCLDRWEQVQETKDNNRQLEGTPAWAWLVSQEQQLMTECASALPGR